MPNTFNSEIQIDEFYGPTQEDLSEYAEWCSQIEAQEFENDNLELSAERLPYQWHEDAIAEMAI